MAPAALPPDDVHAGLGRREEHIGRLLRLLADEPVRVRGDRQLRRVVAGLGRRFLVQLHERGKLGRPAADDGQHQRQAKQSGANDGLGVASAADPYRQRFLHRARVHAEVTDRGAMFALPVDLLRFADLQEQVQLLVE
ncbi:hypothetical protein D1872_280100 [compost metagenome]